MVRSVQWVLTGPGAPDAPARAAFARALDPLLLYLARSRALGPRESEAFVAAAQRSGELCALGLRSGYLGADRLELRLLGPLVTSSPTLGRGLAAFVRYAGLMSVEGTFQLVTDGAEARLTFSAAPATGPAVRAFADEYALGTALRALHAFGLRDAEIVRFEFHHPAPDELAPYALLFGRPLLFAAPCTSIVLPRALLDAANLLADVHAHATYLEVAERICSLRARRSVIERVRTTLDRAPSLKDCDIDEVSRRVGVSGRTLRRMLARKNLTFRSLRDEARAARARAALAVPDCDIAVLADTLGYSEPSAFCRAFRRWTGDTPRHYAKTSLPARFASEQMVG